MQSPCQVQEVGTRETSGLGELFDAHAGHISKAHSAFLQHWDRLIDLEAQDIQVSKGELFARILLNSSPC
jgi:DNA replication ATP-dependent helicase Dna2